VDRVRATFAHQLEELESRIVNDLDAAANTLMTVAAAVQDPDDHRIAMIANDAAKLHASASCAHADLVVITARQTPVASDLRLVLAMIDLAHHTALIANQFDLISQQLAELDPSTVDHATIAASLVRMSQMASAELRKATTAFHARDLARARELDSEDDPLDHLIGRSATPSLSSRFPPNSANSRFARS